MSLWPKVCGSGARWACSCLLVAGAFAAPLPMAPCSLILEDARRLACYDDRALLQMELEAGAGSQPVAEGGRPATAPNEAKPRPGGAAIDYSPLGGDTPAAVLLRPSGAGLRPSPKAYLLPVNYLRLPAEMAGEAAVEAASEG